MVMLSNFLLKNRTIEILLQSQFIFVTGDSNVFKQLTLSLTIINQVEIHIEIQRKYDSLTFDESEIPIQLFGKE